MNDLKKVIKGLETLRKDLGDGLPDRSNVVIWCLRLEYQNSLTDAIALLKRQEPILLENQHKPYGDFLNANAPWISRCPRCGKKIEGRQTRFCEYCGQAVKWDD